MSGVENLARWYTRADDTDKREGALAYPRYHRVMQGLADLWKTMVDPESIKPYPLIAKRDTVEAAPQ
jgi:pyocin large subunit-like protein